MGELVKYNTAKLAKEKGFDWNTTTAFVLESKVGNIVGATPRNWNIEGVFGDEIYINRPTQSLLQKWLREEHKININVKHIPFNQKYGYTITSSYHIGDKGIISSYNFKHYNTYEEALESALLESLSKIEDCE